MAERQRYVVEILDKVDLVELQALAEEIAMELNVKNGFARCGFYLHATAGNVEWLELSRFVHRYLKRGVRLRSRRSGCIINNDGTLFDDIRGSKAFKDARSEADRLRTRSQRRKRKSEANF